ncbi:MAG: copper-translocating P-type ATPase [bacterium]|nr:copper-translocating P-type ATPase [bacterium]
MSKTTEMNLEIKGMHCASCVSSIERQVLSQPGVAECRVNLTTRSAVVKYDRSRLDERDIVDKIAELGFGAKPGRPDILAANLTEETRARHSFLYSLLGTVPLVLVAMWSMVVGEALISETVDGLVEAVLAGLVLFVAGRGILGDAFLQAIHLRANMNSLISLGTLAAFGWSLYALVRIVGGHPEPLYFESAGMIITLILLGRLLEARARRRAGSAIEELLRLRPAVTTAVINGVEIEIDATSAQLGMTLLVKPGERVPADGDIIEGAPVLDESVLTGESQPVEKRSGEKVVGGSLNGNVPFKMKVTSSPEESFLASIIKLVGEAQSRKAPVQQIADRVAGIFVPIVMALAVLTGLAWFYFAPDSPLLMRSVVAVLVIACPCALGLATPTAVLAGTGRGAREGIIIKGGDVLERLSEVDTVVFDKTGTLTRGQLEVVGVKTFGQLSEQNLVRMVGSVESQSEHPVARAIARHMHDRQITPVVVKNVKSRPGFGMVGECDRHHLVVGNRSLLEQEEISLGPSLLQGERDMEMGRSIVFAAMDGQVVGLISLADQIRGEAKDLIAALKERMERVSMLSGDNRKTATGVARSLNLEHFEAEIKPDQKQVIIESYRRAGFKAAMIGDGINDAPALAAASVGVAIGSGTDVAIETADVVLVRSELGAVMKMFRLSEATMKTIRQNLFWAFFYNLVALPVAAGLFYPIFGLTLSPIMAALAMSLSSVFVVSNSVRLSQTEL